MCTWRLLVVQPPFSHRPLPTGEGRVFADIGDLSCKCKVAFQTVVHTNLSITCVFSTCKFSLLKKSASQCAKGRDGSRENVLCGLSSTHARQALHTWQGWISLTEEQTENQKYPSSKKYPAVWNSFWERLAYFFKVQKKSHQNRFSLKTVVYSDDSNSVSRTTRWSHHSEIFRKADRSACPGFLLKVSSAFFIAY